MCNRSFALRTVWTGVLRCYTHVYTRWHTHTSHTKRKRKIINKQGGVACSTSCSWLFSHNGTSWSVSIHSTWPPSTFLFTKGIILLTHVQKKCSPWWWELAHVIATYVTVLVSEWISILETIPFRKTEIKLERHRWFSQSTATLPMNVKSPSTSNQTFTIATILHCSLSHIKCRPPWRLLPHRFVCCIIGMTPLQNEYLNINL